MNQLRRPSSSEGGPRTSRPALAAPITETIAAGTGVSLECLATGAGAPTTVFAHGLAGSIATTRPLASAVAGRRVFFHFRGHGRSTAPASPWTFGDLAADLRAVTDRYAATRALGVSMGATALCRLLSTEPDRFERCVFYLPAPWDGHRPPAAHERLDRLLAALTARTEKAVEAAIAEDVPVAARDTAAGRAYLRERASQLRRDGLASRLATLWQTPALPAAATLSRVTARALVVACAGDEVHPVAAAEQLVALLPDAELHVYDRPQVLWHSRQDLRARISGFLNQSP